MEHVFENDRFGKDGMFGDCVPLFLWTRISKKRPNLLYANVKRTLISSSLPPPGNLTAIWYTLRPPTGHWWNSRSLLNVWTKDTGFAAGVFRCHWPFVRIFLHLYYLYILCYCGNNWTSLPEINKGALPSLTLDACPRKLRLTQFARLTQSPSRSMPVTRKNRVQGFLKNSFLQIRSVTASNTSSVRMQNTIFSRSIQTKVKSFPVANGNKENGFRKWPWASLSQT